MNDTRSFGKAVKRIRLVRGMSRAELAKAAGLTDDAMSQIEQGKLAASEEAMNAVGKALRIPRGCLAILARNKGKTRPMTEFLQSLQKLIAALVEAQETGVAATPPKRHRKAV